MVTIEKLSNDVDVPRVSRSLLDQVDQDCAQGAGPVMGELPDGEPNRRIIKGRSRTSERKVVHHVNDRLSRRDDHGAGLSIRQAVNLREHCLSLLAEACEQGVGFPHRARLSQHTR